MEKLLNLVFLEFYGNIVQSCVFRNVIRWERICFPSISHKCELLSITYIHDKTTSHKSSKRMIVNWLVVLVKVCYVKYKRVPLIKKILVRVLDRNAFTSQSVYKSMVLLTLSSLFLSLSTELSLLSTELSSIPRSLSLRVCDGVQILLIH